MENTPVPTCSLTLAEDKVELLRKDTPREFISTRPGPSGKELSYIDIGYVIAQLNKIFGHVWTFEVVREDRIADQVWVLGRLRVMLSENVILTKEQYGSADVKKKKVRICPTCLSQLPYRYPTCKECSHDMKQESIVEVPLSIGDDMKAAASDAMKKCASMLGLAMDVYHPKLHQKVQQLKKAVKQQRTTTPEGKELGKELDQVASQ